MRIVIWPGAGSDDSIRERARMIVEDPVQHEIDLPSGVTLEIADHPGQDWCLVISYDDIESEYMQAEEVLDLVVSICQSLGAGTYRIRGYEGRIVEFLDTDEKLVDWEARLLYGLPLGMTIEVGAPPVIQIPWPWVTQFVERNAAGTFKPERTIYSNPIRVLFTNLATLLALPGKHRLQFIHDPSGF